VHGGARVRQRLEARVDEEGIIEQIPVAIAVLILGLAQGVVPVNHLAVGVDGHTVSIHHNI
jgi:hypothetical protein